MGFFPLDSQLAGDEMIVAMLYSVAFTIWISKIFPQRLDPDGSHLWIYFMVVYFCEYIYFFIKDDAILILYHLIFVMSIDIFL